jgi:hypothetical protein
MSPPPQTSGRARWLLPLLSAAAVGTVVVAVIGVSALRPGTGSTTPPVLRLANLGVGSGVSRVPVGLPAQSAADSPESSGGGVTNIKSSGWRLQVTLPQGPSSGQVHLVLARQQTRAFVSALGRALRMSGQPQHLTGGWYLVSGSTELSVSERPSGHWVYSNHGCIAGPVLDPAAGAGCAVANSVPPLPPELGAPGAKSAPGAGGTKAPRTTSSPIPVPAPAPVPAPVPVPTPVPVPENVARSIARPVLTAVGINADTAQTQTAGGQTSVTFSPTVTGLSVLGLEASVSIDEHGRIVDASGWLATSTTGPTYPLISAPQAYNQLLHQPQPMMALAMPCRIVAGTQGCLPAPDRAVTGATLGLVQDSTADQAILLVPAWLFHLRGEPTPMAIVAIDGAYLVDSGPIPTGNKPAPGSSPASVGGGNWTNSSTAITGGPTQVPVGPANGAVVKLAR